MVHRDVGDLLVSRQHFELRRCHLRGDRVDAVQMGFEVSGLRNLRRIGIVRVCGVLNDDGGYPLVSLLQF